MLELVVTIIFSTTRSLGKYLTNLGEALLMFLRRPANAYDDCDAESTLVQDCPGYHAVSDIRLASRHEQLRLHEYGSGTSEQPRLVVRNHSNIYTKQLVFAENILLRIVSVFRFVCTRRRNNN